MKRKEDGKPSSCTIESVIIVASTGNNMDDAAAFVVDNSIRVIDAATPKAGQVSLQRFGLSNA